MCSGGGFFGGRGRGGGDARHRSPGRGPWARAGSRLVRNPSPDSMMRGSTPVPSGEHWGWEGGPPGRRRWGRGLGGGATPLVKGWREGMGEGSRVGGINTRGSPALAVGWHCCLRTGRRRSRGSTPGFGCTKCVGQPEAFKWGFWWKNQKKRGPHMEGEVGQKFASGVLHIFTCMHFFPVNFFHPNFSEKEACQKNTQSPVTNMPSTSSPSCNSTGATQSPTPPGAENPMMTRAPLQENNPAPISKLAPIQNHYHLCFENMI